MSIECNGEGNIAVQTIVDGVNENSARLDEWIGTVNYVVGDFIYSATDGFYYQCKVDNIGSQPVIGNANWLRWSPVNYFEVDLTKTVGATGDYATLDEALLDTSKWISISGAKLTLDIEDGHSINYPINLKVIASNTEITYAGAGSLIIDFNNTVLSDDSRSFINIEGENILFRDMDISTIGTLDGTALSSWVMPIAIGGSVSFDTCNISINASISSTQSTIFRLIGGILTDVNITVVNYTSLDNTNSGIIELIAAEYHRNITIDANNIDFGTPIAISYLGAVIDNISISNAVNTTYGIYLRYAVGFLISGSSSFRKGVSDSVTDIYFQGSSGSITATGGSNVAVGEFSAAGGRYA